MDDARVGIFLQRTYLAFVLCCLVQLSSGIQPLQNLPSLFTKIDNITFISVTLGFYVIAGMSVVISYASWLSLSVFAASLVLIFIHAYRHSLEAKEQSHRISLLESQLQCVQQQSAKTDAFYQLVLRHIHQGVLGIDENGCIDFSNSTAQDILGFPATHIHGQKMHSLMRNQPNENIYQEAQCYLAKTLKDGTTRVISHDVFWHSDGTPIDISYVVAALRDGEQITGAVVIFSNTSGDRKYQRLLKKSKQRFRDLVAHGEQAREQERAHIAREIHDELGQQLTALRMDITLLKIKNPDVSPDLHYHLELMKGSVDNCIQSVREVASRLRPAVLDMGLPEAIDWLLNYFKSRHGVGFTIDCQCHNLSLDDARATAVFRVVQESLTNVARHADANHVTVSMNRSSNVLHITITDDGKGFDPKVVRQMRGFGLMSIRERVLIFGGRARFESTIGQGTTVHLSIPLGEQKKDHDTTSHSR